MATQTLSMEHDFVARTIVKFTMEYGYIPVCINYVVQNIPIKEATHCVLAKNRVGSMIADATLIPEDPSASPLRIEVVNTNKLTEAKKKAYVSAGETCYSFNATRLIKDSQSRESLEKRVYAQLLREGLKPEF